MGLCKGKQKHKNPLKIVMHLIETLSCRQLGLSAAVRLLCIDIQLLYGQNWLATVSSCPQKMLPNHVIISEWIMYRGER